MMNFLELNKESKSFELPNYDFLEENITVDEIDYYHSNVVARSSKTMTDCKNTRITFYKTGTEN